MKPLVTQNIHPDIVFRPSGLITLTSRIVRILDINEGDVINILQDNGEYYLYVQHRSPIGKFCGKCLKHKNGSHYMRVYYKRLSDIIISMSGDSEAHYKTGEPINHNGRILLPIITKLNLYNKPV